MDYPLTFTGYTLGIVDLMGENDSLALLLKRRLAQSRDFSARLWRKFRR